MTHKLCEAMSTTVNIGLNQTEHVVVNQSESAAGASIETNRTPLLNEEENECHPTTVPCPVKKKRDNVNYHR